jgi:hypothetical protein
MLNRIMFKPEGMHQKTFDRLWRQVEMLESRALKQMLNKSLIRQFRPSNLEEAGQNCAKFTNKPYLGKI